MLFNDQYNPTSMARFQVSLLSLGGALELPAAAGAEDVNDTKAEAERLKTLFADAGHW